MQIKYVYSVRFEHVLPQLPDSLHDTMTFIIVLILTVRWNLNTKTFGVFFVCKCKKKEKKKDAKVQYVWVLLGSSWAQLKWSYLLLGFLPRISFQETFYINFTLFQARNYLPVSWCHDRKILNFWFLMVILLGFTDSSHCPSQHPAFAEHKSHQLFVAHQKQAHETSHAQYSPYAHSKTQRMVPLKKFVWQIHIRHFLASICQIIWQFSPYEL